MLTPEAKSQTGTYGVGLNARTEFSLFFLVLGTVFWVAALLLLLLKLGVIVCNCSCSHNTDNLCNDM